jgi:hypothetical protein
MDSIFWLLPFAMAGFDCRRSPKAAWNRLDPGVEEKIPLANE